jgi:DNA (cytosine-5)-methyltransferase 1
VCNVTTLTGRKGEKTVGKAMTVGSLFSGIGGFDLGLERAGMVIQWQVENNAACRQVLFCRWPYVPHYEDIREFVELDVSAVNVICGGDPCSVHSRARSNGPSAHPDLAGFFLSVVGRLRPQWVVRENVLAPTVAWFDAALNALGYGTIVVRLDAAMATCQSRKRDFIVGCRQATRARVAEVFADAEDGPGPSASRLETRPVAPCLTTHRTRYDSRDCYIFEPKRGLRILDGDERDALAGLPEGWTAGFSEATRARMCGNAVPPVLAEWLGRRIVAVEAQVQ